MARLEPRQLSTIAASDAVRRVLPSAPPHDPGEAQLVGRVVMLKALGRRDVDPAGTVDVLHRWAFGRPAEDQSTAYWRDQLGRKGGIGELIAELSASTEIRTSSLRLRSLTGINATLIEDAAATEARTAGPGQMTAPPMDRAEVEHILKSSRTPMDFVKAAYVLILGRDYDTEGLERHVTTSLDRSNWDMVIETFYGSNEYKERHSRMFK